MPINNTPAFPLGRQSEHDELGMSLRDYFAAKAMPLVFQHLREAYANDGERFEICGPASDLDFLAADSYAIADAMLRARSQA